MNAGATADRVYDAIKRQLLSGALLPGDKLDPARFADDLNASKTPVRDALHRLAGERLVETKPGEGFHLPRVTEPSLRDLYMWHRSLLRFLVGAWPRDVDKAKRTDLPADLARTPGILFGVFAARTGNAEFARQLDAISDRLASARAAERIVLTDLEIEARSLAETLDRKSRTDILHAVTAYHRRRLRAIADIVEAIYRRE